MRFVVFGAGAIGGLVGAQLREHGHDVVLVARGEHLDRLCEHGLQVESPTGTTTVRVPTVGDVSTLGLSDNDVVLLTTKSQHSADALDTLAAAARPTLPIVCIQNGVENERLALRHFANVYAVCVMCPATHLRPGVIQAHRAPVPGILDVGRYPTGVDPAAERLASAFHDAGFASETKPDIMRWKYAKLLLNLANALEAIAGPASRSSEVAARARAEGVACLDAAGIAYASEAEDAERRGALVPLRPSGQHRGGSSWQSLARQTGNVEADYLNGEIVLLGRLHGVDTPVNAALQRLASELARRRSGPGTISADDLTRLVS